MKRIESKMEEKYIWKKRKKKDGIKIREGDKEARESLNTGNRCYRKAVYVL